MRSTSSSRTGAIPDLEKTYITDKKVAQDAGVNGVTGLIHWYVPPWLVAAIPGHPRLEQPQQVRRQVQDDRVRRQGPVPGQRPDLRPGRPGDHQEPQAELQGRRLRQRGRVDRGIPAGRGAEDLAHRLLLRPAVAARRAAARPGQAAAVHAPSATATTPRPPAPRSPATTRSTRSTRSSRPSSPRRWRRGYTLVKNFTWKNADQNAVAVLHHQRQDDPRGRRQEVARREPHRLAGVDAAFLTAATQHAPDDGGGSRRDRRRCHSVNVPLTSRRPRAWRTPYGLAQDAREAAQSLTTRSTLSA